MTNSSEAAVSDLPALTGLRFWAAMSILLNHLLLGLVARDNAWFSPLLGASGTLGMDVFFILSGFIIHYNYAARLAQFTRRSLWQFFVARLSRLYPLYILLVALDISTTSQSFAVRSLYEALPFYLTMTQSWFYHQVASGATVTYLFGRMNIAWSISTEMLMYCSYPALLMLLLRDRLGHKSRLAVVAMAAIAISLGLRWLNLNLAAVDQWSTPLLGEGTSMASAPSYSFALWLVLLSPYVRVFEFIIGVMTAHLFMQLRGQAPGPAEARLGPLLALAALGFILATFLPAFLEVPGARAVYDLTGYYPFIAIIVFGCARYRQAMTTRLFALPWLVGLGEFSYSIYLFHIFIYSAVNLEPAGAAVTCLRIAAVWAVVFSCAYVLYTFIEMPLRRRMRMALSG